jgi:putative ABC transport system permease protein
MLNDLRYGVRTLVKNAGFTAVMVVTLALGIGANTVVFSVVHAILLRPLPYKDPDRLVSVSESSGSFQRGPASFPQFLDWKSHSEVFEEIVAFGGRRFVLTSKSMHETVEGCRVSAGFLKVLGVRPALGRDFLPEEYQPTGTQVALLTHGLWRRRFGGESDILGKTVILDGEPCTLVGVLAADLKLPGELESNLSGFYRSKVELVVPLAVAPHEARRQTWFLRVIARLKPEVSLERAQTDMSMIARRLEREYPDSNLGKGIKVEKLSRFLRGDTAPVLLILMASVAFVLMIACTNVASLLLTRVVEREKEIAIRTALGAGRRRVVRQLLTENLLLSMLGGLAGFFLAQWGIELVGAFCVEVNLQIPELRVDAAVLLFTLLMSVLTGIAFGLTPALKTSKVNLNESLKEGGGSMSPGRSGRRIQDLLVIAEVMFSMTLLIGAGLLIHSFLRLWAVDPGFRPNGVLILNVVSAKPQPPASQWVTFVQQLLARLAALPGVASAALTEMLPLSGGDMTYDFQIEGHAQTERSEEAFRRVSAGYFSAMGIPLIKGRYFNDRDSENAPKVAVINLAMARKYWGSEELLGTRIRIAGAWRTIVGIIGNVRHSNLEKGPNPEIYVPSVQADKIFGSTLVVRTTGDPLGMVGAVKREIQALDPNYFADDIRTMKKVLSNSEAERQLVVLLMTFFAALALILAATGMFGVISYSVSQRTREIGIRMALGAQRSDVVRLVLREGLTVVGCGIALGLGAALAGTRFLSSQLFGVTTTDPITFVAIALLLVAVALVGCYIPARWATKVDPLVALRYE